MDFNDWWLRHLLWNCPNMNVTGLRWWSVNIGSGNGLVPSDNKTVTWANVDPGPIFCLLLGVSSDYAQPITGQVTEVTCPVIGRAQPELTPSKRQKMGPDLCGHMASLGLNVNIEIMHGLAISGVSHIDELVQEIQNSIANALKLSLFCTIPLLWGEYLQGYYCLCFVPKAFIFKPKIHLECGPSFSAMILKCCQWKNEVDI